MLTMRVQKCKVQITKSREKKSPASFLVKHRKVSEVKPVFFLSFATFSWNKRPTKFRKTFLIKKMKLRDFFQFNINCWCNKKKQKKKQVTEQQLSSLFKNVQNKFKK